MRDANALAPNGQPTNQHAQTHRSACRIRQSTRCNVACCSWHCEARPLGMDDLIINMRIPTGVRAGLGVRLRAAAVRRLASSGTTIRNGWRSSGTGGHRNKEA
eukprot:scaffold15750_cov19-Tisochrysis_lutea.AAC.1